MRARNTTSGTRIVVSTLLILLILVVINLITTNTVHRVDLTENKEFTVSSSTRNVVRNLDDLVTIKVYFSKDLPSYMANLPRSVRDLLDEYAANSKGNLRVRWEDPDKSPEMKRKLQQLGIPQVQLDVIQKDKRELANIYLGMVVLYEDKHEAIPVVQGPWGLEYELTTAILKVTRKESPKLGIISRFPREDFDQRYQQMQMVLGKQYEIEFVDLEGGQRAVPDDITTLMLVSPKDLSGAEQYRIDQFVMNGGKVFALLDVLEMGGLALQGTRMSSGLEDLMASYGLRLNSDMLVDRISSMASFSTGFMRFMSNYPLWPKVVKANFDQENPVVSKLETITMPWTRSLDTVGAPPDSVELTALASSSPASWTTTSFGNLNPQQQWTPKEEDLHSRGLVYALTGVFPSFFAGKEIPAVADSNAAPIDVSARRDESIPTQIIVVGNSYFATDQFLSQFPGNLTFLLNSIDWMSMGDELMGIRSKHVVERPLREISQGHKSFLRLIGMFLMPLIVVCVGLARAAAAARLKRLGEAETERAA